MSNKIETQYSPEEISKILDEVLCKPVPVSGETLTAIVTIAKQRGVEILTPDERKTIEALLPRWKNCHNTVNAHTVYAAKDAWLAHQQRMADRIAAGASVTDKEDGWSRQDWEEDYRSKMQAAKLGGAKIVGEAIATAAPAFDRFSKFCEDFAIEQEAGEISVCENLKIPYSPSLIIRTIRSAPAAAKHRLPTAAMWGHNPENIIGWML